MLTYKLPPTLANEIDELQARITQFNIGSLSEAELKAYRVPFGVYEQRIKGLYMVRIRCAAGIITPYHLKNIAVLADRYGSGRLHVTTRQEIQMHDLALDKVVPVIRGLMEMGLSSRGGGGNTVRNITASWDSGIAPNEVFDVAPYAVELTTRMIALPGSWLLPRKFKIAFSNTACDNAFATVNDLGFVATVKNGTPGFRVFVAGGMGRMPQAGQILHDFISCGEVFEVAEAVKRLFSANGNRRNKHTARLRFLWHSLGRKRFVELYENERRALAAEGYAPLGILHESADTIVSSLSTVSLTPATAPQTMDDFDLWKRRCLYPQRQSGFFAVRVPLALGDLSVKQAIMLAEFLETFGNDVMRFTQDQNIALRNIPQAALEDVFQKLCTILSQVSLPRVISSAVACAGASTCQLGICLSRGALAATIERLRHSTIDLDALEDFRLHFSGCSNSCGQHAVAHLGFYGKVGRKDGLAYPAYTVVAGGIIEAQTGTKLAQQIGEIAARDVPSFVEQFLGCYVARKELYASFEDYLEQHGIEHLHALCESYRDIPLPQSDESYYRDWGAESRFSLEGRRSGECAAGLFDLIDIQMCRMRNALKEAQTAVDETSRLAALTNVIVQGARALLVTKGLEAVNENDIAVMFDTHLIATGIIGRQFRALIETLVHHKERLLLMQEDVVAFAKAVETAYAALDDTLQFHIPHELQPEQDAVTAISVDRVADLRGVACPMNFVKAKMALYQLQIGQVLEVLLDEGEPFDNVPRSLSEEGHSIIESRKLSNYWSVIIKKEK